MSTRRRSSEEIQTRIWKVDSKDLTDSTSASKLEEAGQALREGNVVAFPTETVYGLGASACDDDAGMKIYAAKGRPSDNPLIVHLAHPSDLTNVIHSSFITPLVQKIIDEFWPGPLSIVFPYDESLAREQGMTHVISSSVRANNSSVAIRVPSDPIAQSLIRCASVPIAAPSANRSGRPSPTTADHVQHDLFGRIFGIVDGGPVCYVGVESTVIKVLPPRDGLKESHEIRILRPGFVTAEMLAKIVPAECVSYTIDDPSRAVDPSKSTTPESKSYHPECPGTKYRHYSPDKHLSLCVDDEVMFEIVQHCLSEGAKMIGVLITNENTHFVEYESNDHVHVSVVGSRNDLSSVTRNLFGCLRELDETESICLLGEQFESEIYSRNDLHVTIMNRLRKAAGYSVVGSVSEFTNLGILAAEDVEMEMEKGVKRLRSEDECREAPPAKKARVEGDG